MRHSVRRRIAMKKFGLIRSPGSTSIGQYVDLDDALQSVGLNSRQIDFGCLKRPDMTPGISIVVYEFGLKEPPQDQHFFAIGRSLFAGNAVLFAFDDVGSTIDLEQMPPVLFFRDHHEVERSIEEDIIDRPEISVNGRVLWQWRGE